MGLLSFLTTWPNGPMVGKLTIRKLEQRRLTSVEEAEQFYFESVRREMRLRPNASPEEKRRVEMIGRAMGYSKKEWEELKATMQPGDQLWEYCSDKRSWNMHMGLAGYLLTRNGVEIGFLMTAMN